jgi:Mlc titration factor MtfA (ptsG expression regulator)
MQKKQPAGCFFVACDLVFEHPASHHFHFDAAYARIPHEFLCQPLITR